MSTHSDVFDLAINCLALRFTFFEFSSESGPYDPSVECERLEMHWGSSSTAVFDEHLVSGR